MYDKGTPPETVASVKRRRRTQAERSSATRKAICEATLDALVEYGYERTSTTLIAEKAKVSRGALTHHFPTRNELFLAAYRYLVDAWAEGWPLGPPHAEGSISAPELIDGLWDKIFANKRYLASLELMLASRLDSELGRALREMILDWVQRRDEIAMKLLGSSIEHEDDRLFLQLSLAVLRGIAINRSFDEDEAVSARLLEMWRDIVRQNEAKRLAR